MDIIGGTAEEMKVTTIILVIVNFANAKIDIKNSIKNNSSVRFFAVI